MDQSQDGDKGSRLLKIVQAIAISPEDACQIVDGFAEQSERKYPNDSEEEHRLRVADKIVKRYSKQAAVVGGTTALSGVVPGVGTAVAVIGGATTDTAVCMKLQVDMCMCLAYTFGYDIPPKMHATSRS